MQHAHPCMHNPSKHSWKTCGGRGMIRNRAWLELASHKAVGAIWGRSPDARKVTHNARPLQPDCAGEQSTRNYSMNSACHHEPVNWELKCESTACLSMPPLAGLPPPTPPDLSSTCSKEPVLLHARTCMGAGIANDGGMGVLWVPPRSLERRHARVRS
jgi:hypothetical protein